MQTMAEPDQGSPRHRPMRIGYAGAPGAFAHEACLAFAPRCEPVAFDRFEAVAAAVQAGEAEKGMLPLRNSRAGEVPGIADLIRDADLEVEREGALPVRMHLLGLEGAELAQLTIVRSHPVALRQCAEAIARLGLATESASNTAIAARDLREKDVAVLASEAAADAYGLKLLIRDVQDDPNNRTTFAIVTRRRSEAGQSA